MVEVALLLAVKVAAAVATKVTVTSLPLLHPVPIGRRQILNRVALHLALKAKVAATRAETIVETENDTQLDPVRHLLVKKEGADPLHHRPVHPTALYPVLLLLHLYAAVIVLPAAAAAAAAPPLVLHRLIVAEPGAEAQFTRPTVTVEVAGTKCLHLTF